MQEAELFQSKLK